MTDYSAALIDARKQLSTCEALAALHDFAGALGEIIKCCQLVDAIYKSLRELQVKQNAQRAT